MMESKNKSKLVVETQHNAVETWCITSLQEAWSRFLNDSYTLVDLALILDSIKDDEKIREFHEVSDKLWNEIHNNTSPESEERKETYRKEAARLLTEYERKRSIQASSRNIGHFRKIWYAAAAVLLLGILIPTAYHYMKPKTEQTELVVQYVEAVTQRGKIKTIILPDQTKVTLNAESLLTYPADFADNERSVELQGEALFDVTPDNERPFTVTTTDVKVSVLGTVFDVKAYSDDESLSVSVISGKVEVETWHAASYQPNRAASIVLEQNHQVKMNKAAGSFEKLTIDAEKYLLWIDGTLYFHRTPIREVVNMLNRYYPQAEVELAEGEYSGLISGEHDNKRMEAVLTSIVYSTGINYKKIGNKYILYQN